MLNISNILLNYTLHYIVKYNVDSVDQKAEDAPDGQEQDGR